VFRVQALPAPSDRQKSQMFFQRYMERFPSGGEIVIFDRSWYNRAGVECVMGFCTKEQHQTFLYAAIAGMCVYALFGTSRQLAVIATSSSAAMLAALVAPIAVDDSTRDVVLTFGAAIAAGAIFLLGGTLKLGVVSEFISKPVLKGFVFGLAPHHGVAPDHITERGESGIALHFARVADRVRDLFDRSGFTDRIGSNRIFPGVDYAVDAILQNGTSQDKVLRH
jgi:hypothetical protein